MPSNHLRPEAGGDPTRGSLEPRTDESAIEQNDFPDAPDATVDDTPQDQPDLDAFAARMGTDRIESDDPPDTVEDPATAKLQLAAAGGVLAVSVGVFLINRRRSRGIREKLPFA